MTRITQLTLLIFAVALVAGCTKQSANVWQQLPLSPVAQEVQRHGYHVKESTVVEPTAWERSTFRTRSKRQFSFRADRPLPNAPVTYYRFNLIEETFDSEVDAQDRVARIHLADPSGPAEEQHFLSAMRTGFHAGNVAYVFQTDAAMFWDEVQRLAAELSRSMAGRSESR